MTDPRDIFDRALQNPDSARGYDIERTCQILAQEARSHTEADFKELMLALQEIYIEQFLHTATYDRSFPARIRVQINKTITPSS